MPDAPPCARCPRLADAYLSDRVLVMSARPGRLLSEFSIDEPRAERDDLRLSPTTLERTRQIRAFLRESQGMGVLSGKT